MFLTWSEQRASEAFSQLGTTMKGEVYAAVDVGESCGPERGGSGLMGGDMAGIGPVIGGVDTNVDVPTRALLMSPGLCLV